MKMLMMINFFMPILFINSFHPVMYMTVILLQTIFICLMVWMLSQSSWFSYILFLIFLGGLMVLFIYITSLAANEKFYLSLYNSIKMFMVTMTMLTMLLINMNSQMLNSNYFLSMNMFKEMFSIQFMMLTTMTMIYLFLTLIVVTKMVSKMSGPIRNSMYF